MSFSVASFGRTLLTAGLVALALSACGRRGPPEAPPDPSVTPPQRGARTSQATPAGGPGPSQATGELDDEEVETGPVVVPSPRPARNPRRGYVVPQQPFILDPLL
jgi:predicted small lipoprotein YifL